MCSATATSGRGVPRRRHAGLRIAPAPDSQTPSPPTPPPQQRPAQRRGRSGGGHRRGGGRGCRARGPAAEGNGSETGFKEWNAWGDHRAIKSSHGMEAHTEDMETLHGGYGGVHGC
jgi:hypothetical protein